MWAPLAGSTKEGLMRRKVLGSVLLLAAVGFSGVLSASTGCGGGTPECDAYCACPEKPCANGKPSGDKSEDACKAAKQLLQMFGKCGGGGGSDSGGGG